MARRAALVGILVAAAALRLRGLDIQSLWHDELFTWYAAHQPSLAAAVRVGAVQDVHPPGFVLGMYAWIRAVGDSEVALRLPAALAGILAVAWIARLGEEWLSAEVGLTAAALTATSWFAIYYSQEARPYAWLLLGATALAERITAQVRRPSAGRLVAVGGIAIATSYVHYFGLLFSACALTAWGIHALRVREGRAGWAAVCAGWALAYLPWAPSMVAQAARGPIWIDQPTAAAGWAALGAMANGSGLALLAVWLAGAMAAGSRRVSPAVGLLIGWAVAPVAVALAVSWAVLPVLTERNLVIVLPAVALLTAAALEAVDRRLGGWRVATIAVVALLLLDLVGFRDYYHRPTKWQYREVAATIAADDATPRPYVVANAWSPAYFDYYFAQLGSNRRVDAKATGAEAIGQALSGPRPPVVFVAAEVPRPGRRHGGLTLDGYRLDQRWEWIGWDLYRFVRDP